MGAQHIVRLATLDVPNEADSLSGSSHIDACWWQLSATGTFKTSTHSIERGHV